MNIPADRAQEIKDWLFDPEQGGRFYAKKRPAKKRPVENIACPECLGTGKYRGKIDSDTPCAYCEGTGKGIA